MSIRDTLAKIKSFAASNAGSDVAVTLIVILVGTGSFGLGRLSVSSTLKEPIQIIEPASLGAEAAGETRLAVSGQTASVAGSESVVASKTGSKYHFPWCPGASQISEANKVQFTTAEAARAAGYLPAANCKGLK